MDLEQAREVVERYHEFLIDVEAVKSKGEHGPSSQGAKSHLHWMLEQMDGMLDEIDSLGEKALYDFGEAGSENWNCFQRFNEAWDKFYRWLGFVQGVFWMEHSFTLEEMKGHNRQPAPPFTRGMGAMMPDEWMGKTPAEITELRRKK